MDSLFTNMGLDMLLNGSPCPQMRTTPTGVIRHGQVETVLPDPPVEVREETSDA